MLVLVALVALLVGLVPAAVLWRRLRATRAELDETRAQHQDGRGQPPARARVRVGRDISTPAVTTLSGLVLDGDRPHVVLVLGAFASGQVFAGIRTTVLASARLAAELDRPLRVVVCQSTDTDPADTRAALEALVREESGHPALADTLRLSIPGQRDDHGHHGDDVWVATFWTTAWALKGLVRQGLVRADRVVYLVQDFEPGFYPWGPIFAKAWSTYEAGFARLVNSASLSSYLANQTSQPDRPELAFAPALDLAPLTAAAARWQPAGGDMVRVLFYARPSKPRNMYAAGVEALRLWADALPEGVTALVRFAGEDIAGDAVDLGPRARVEMCGKLTYHAYYDLLTDTDVGLALMLSPHPGHLALELPLAGIPTVTNDFAGYRHRWVDGLTVSGTDPDSIAAGLGTATTAAGALTAHVPGMPQVGLGGTLDEAVARVAAGLR